MKANAAAMRGKSPQSNTRINNSKAAESQGTDTAKKAETKAAEKVVISDEAKAKAAELAEENKQLKAKLKDSKIDPSGNQKLRVEKSQDGARMIRRPGIFLLGGLNLGGLTSSDGIAAMGEHIPQAEHFEWGEERQVLDQIRRRPPGEAIILVGHGLGGDSAVNIANKLNTLEHGYRKVNLLITLDSTGSNNDIIPQNVEENLNFIDGDGGFLSDGPNIARNKELSNVKNNLLGEYRGSMDENTDVQFNVFEKINTVLAKTQKDNTVNQFLEKAREGQMVKISAEKLNKLVAKDLSGIS